MTKLQFQWIAQYEGASPDSDEPAIVGELRAGEPIEPRSALKACAELLAAAPVDVGEAAPALDRNSHEDGLLALGELAAAWSLAVLNEVRGFLTSAGAARQDDTVRIWLAFHDPALSRKVLELALRWLASLLSDGAYAASASDHLNALWRACRTLHPDYQARILMVGARDLDIPVMRFLPGQRLWQFGWGARSRVFLESLSNADGALGAQLQRDKDLSKQVIRMLGLPTPEARVIENEGDLNAALERIGYPCVIKPLRGGGGKGVTANIQSREEAFRAYEIACKGRTGRALVEKHLAGHDHRLLVVEGRLIATIRRQASSVRGDGKRTIAELIGELNEARTANLVASRYHRPIPIDGVLKAHLAQSSLTLETVLEKGQEVTLRSNANLSTGGFCTDLSSQTHPAIRAMAEQLAGTAGLATAGLDYVTSDISAPPGQVEGGFIEMNTVPGLDACVAAGWSEAKVARAVLGETLGYVPVDVNVIPDQSLEDRARVLRDAPRAAGSSWVCGRIGVVGEAEISSDSEEPWTCVRAALRNVELRELTIYCSGREIQRHGLPVSRIQHVDIRDPGLGEDWKRLLMDCASSYQVS